MLRDLYQQLLPKNVRLVLSPALRGIWNSFCRALGKNPASEGIGIVPTYPFYARAYLKKSFAQQGEDLIVDRILQQ